MGPRAAASAVLASLLWGGWLGDAGATSGPQFSAPVFKLTGIDAWRVVAADVDGDGDADVVSIDSRHKLSVLRGTGDGNFGPPEVYRTVRQHPFAEPEWST